MSLAITLKRLREERKALCDKAGALLTKAAEEKRSLSTEEDTQFTAIHADADEMLVDIQRYEKQIDAAGETEHRSLREIGREDRRGGRNPGEVTPETRSLALAGYIMAGSPYGPNEQQLDAMHACGLSQSQRSIQFNLFDQAPRNVTEARALQTNITTAGGFTVADELIRAVEIALLRHGGVRKVANVFRTSTGADLPVPTINDTSNEGVILGESTEATETEPTTGQVIFKGYKYSSKMVKVSVEMIQDSSINVPAVLGNLLGIRIARKTNRDFTVGTNASQPNGVVTASVLGKTAASATAVTYSELVDLLHSVDSEYRDNGASWMFSDSTLAALKKLVDGQSRPLWAAGISGDVPATLLNHPYTVNNHMPAMTTGLKSILFGDFSTYWIRDISDVQVLRLDERYAEFGQVAFLAFSRHDGRPVNAGTNPIKHLIQA